MSHGEKTIQNYLFISKMLINHNFKENLSCSCNYNNFFLLSYSVSSQSAGSEIKPLTYGRGGDNVLLGRSYCTPHVVVTDEYGAMVE
jgi:hypothetical protein